MLKAIYRSIILAQTANAASQVLNFVSDEQLADMGHSRASFVQSNVERVFAQFDADDANEQYAAVNANLVGAV